MKIIAVTYATFAVGGGGGKTIEMWWWWWWENKRNVQEMEEGK